MQRVSDLVLEELCRDAEGVKYPPRIYHFALDLRDLRAAARAVIDNEDDGQMLDDGVAMDALRALVEGKHD